MHVFQNKSIKTNFAAVSNILPPPSPHSRSSFLRRSSLSGRVCVSAFVADLISFYFALRSTSHSPGGSGGDFFVHCKTSSPFSCRNFPALSCFVIHYHNHSILGTCNVNLYTPLSLTRYFFASLFFYIPSFSAENSCPRTFSVSAAFVDCF